MNALIQIIRRTYSCWTQIYCKSLVIKESRIQAKLVWFLDGSDGCKSENNLPLPLNNSSKLSESDAPVKAMSEIQHLKRESALNRSVLWSIAESLPCSARVFLFMLSPFVLRLVSNGSARARPPSARSRVTDNIGGVSATLHTFIISLFSNPAFCYEIYK